MNEDKLYELLLQKQSILLKRINRYLLYLYLIPIIYFLLISSVIKEVKMPFITIDQTEIILVMTPVAYASLMLVIIVLLGRINKIHKAIFKFDLQNKSSDFKNKNLLNPIIFIDEFYNNKNKKGFIYYVELFMIYLPLTIITVFSPLAFIVYIINRNFNYTGDLQGISFWLGLLAIWIIIALIFQIIGNIKNSGK